MSLQPIDISLFIGFLVSLVVAFFGYLTMKMMNMVPLIIGILVSVFGTAEAIVSEVKEMTRG